MALAFVNDKDVIEKVFGELSERYAERSGGYTRVLKLGPRQGDGAPMAILELVE
jgi:large subunit ribosomal protein L17